MKRIFAALIALSLVAIGSLTVDAERREGREAKGIQNEGQRPVIKDVRGEQEEQSRQRAETLGVPNSSDVKGSQQELSRERQQTLNPVPQVQNRREERHHKKGKKRRNLPNQQIINTD